MKKFFALLVGGTIVLAACSSTGNTGTGVSSSPGTSYNQTSTGSATAYLGGTASLNSGASLGAPTASLSIAYTSSGKTVAASGTMPRGLPNTGGGWTAR